MHACRSTLEDPTLLFVPAVQAVPERIDCAPYLAAAAPEPFPDLLRQVATEHAIPAGREPELERELARHAPKLDRLVSLAAAARPPAFANTADYRALRIATFALTARGVWHAKHGRGDAAMLQWITALRLARVVARGTATRLGNLIEGMISSAMEREAFKALRWYASDMTYGQWSLMQRELEARAGQPHTLRDFMLGERAGAVRFFERAHADGGFAERELGIYLSRSLLPLRHADRAKFMDEVRDRYLRAFDADLATTVGNTTGASTHELKTDYFLVLAPFSREHSVTRMTNLLLVSTAANYQAAGNRLEKTEELARELAKYPAPLDLEGI